MNTYFEKLRKVKKIVEYLNHLVLKSRQEQNVPIKIPSPTAVHLKDIKSQLEPGSSSTFI